MTPKLTDSQKREVAEVIERVLVADFRQDALNITRRQIMQAVCDTMEGMIENGMRNWEPQLRTGVTDQFEASTPNRVKEEAAGAVIEGLRKTQAVQRIISGR